MSELKNLYSLFSTTFFRIPDFQRGYAWSTRQLDELWNDLDSIPSESQHYMGTLFVEENFKKATSDQWVEGGNFVGVVDGQQRLTTLAILLFVLIKYSENRGYARQSLEDLRRIYLYVRDSDHLDIKSYKFCYDEASNSREYRNYLVGEIFEDSSVYPGTLKSLYVKNLLEAKKYFEEKIRVIDYSQREKLFRKVTSQLRFDYRSIDGDFDVQMVFETLNNRGKPLTILEKLKNRLMYQATRLEESDSLKQKLSADIKNIWGHIYEQLASDVEHPLDEDEFLAAHLSLYRRPRENVFSEKQAEETLFRMFANFPERFQRNSDPREKMEPPISFEKINNYIHDLESFLSYWTTVHREKGTIQKIRTLNSAREMKILLCAILARMRDSAADELLDLLEKIAFRNSVPGAAFKDLSSFASSARALYPRKESIDQIESVSPEAMLWTWRQDCKDAPVQLESVASAFSGLYAYQRGNKGFHRWSGLKFFLFEYEATLVSRTTEHSPRVTLDRYASISIDHVMPQQWKDYWAAEMNDFLSLIPDVESHSDAQKTILNSLGNLTIIGARTNSVLQNKSWIAWDGEGGKKNLYGTEGTFSEGEIAQNQRWDYKTILQRGSSLLDFLAEKLCAGKFTLEQKQKALLFNPKIYKDIDWPCPNE